MSHDGEGRKRESESIRQRGSRVEVVPDSRNDVVEGKEWLRCAVDSDL